MSNNSGGGPPLPPHHPSSSSASAYRTFYNHPNQNNNTTTTSSSEDISWLDFLRAAGGTVSNNAAPERSTSADRKRRHAGTSPDERRATPQQRAYNSARTSATMAASSGDLFAGNSRDNAIDLTSPSPPQRQRPQMPQRVSGSVEDRSGGSMRAPPRPGMGSHRGSSITGNFTGRQDSNEIILPRWQPDGEVTRCPVCRTEFGFFYRKHHCRKCGRVVCAACSPHRITIPRQYVVLPPGSEAGDGEASSPTTRGTGQRNLGGGEVVRVCNPCVPDPWTPDASSPGEARGIGDEQGGRTQRPERYRAAVQSPGQPFPPGFMQHPTPANFNRSNNAYTRNTYNAVPSLTPSQQQPTNHTYRHVQSSWPAPIPHAAPPPPPRQSHRQTISVSATSPPTAPQPPPQPRREIPEEDECPVCGTELPQGDAARESHIQECIASRFAISPSSSSAPPPPQANAPFAPPRTSSIASSLPQNATQTPPAPQQRPRASTYRPRGMAIYRATEKDCVNAEGEAQECVICFEEFQPGEELGRMECLCKFHRQCIRGWWERRGGGCCPTHMLHE